VRTAAEIFLMEVYALYVLRRKLNERS